MNLITPPPPLPRSRQQFTLLLKKLSSNFHTFKEPKNRFQGTNSTRLCSLAGRYDNPIPNRFLVPIDCLKKQALDFFQNHYHRRRHDVTEQQRREPQGEHLQNPFHIIPTKSHKMTDRIICITISCKMHHFEDLLLQFSLKEIPDTFLMLSATKNDNSFCLNSRDRLNNY